MGKVKIARETVDRNEMVIKNIRAYANQHVFSPFDRGVKTEKKNDTKIHNFK